MAQQQAPGGHYSGHNPIPTVRQFVENLDRDKKHRDKEIDERAKAANAQAGATPTTPTRAGKKTSAANTPKSPAQDGVEDHKLQKRTIEGTEKTVTDPTTGREVVISDVGKEMVDEVENPHLIVPNANLNKPTVGEPLIFAVQHTENR
jgi:hypothetical protein